MKIFLSTILVFFLAISAVNASYTITGTLSTGGSIPKAPESVSAELSGTSAIFIDWDPVVSVQGYRIYRKIGGGVFTLLNETANTSYTDSGLTNGTYSYQIQSFLGSLATALNGIAPTSPITIVIPTPTPTPSGGGGGGGGGGLPPASTPSPTPLPNQGNSNGDGVVDILDFNTLISNWGQTGSGNTADFNGDGVVDILDFNILMANWS